MTPTEVIPVASEEVHVGKHRRVTGRTRVKKVVEQTEQIVDEPLLFEDVSVERVPINQYVEEPWPIRHEKDLTVIPVFEEVLVVEKRLLLKEEVHITKIAKERRKPEKVVVRREKVIVEHDDLSQD